MESRESEFSEVYVFRMSSKLLKSSLGENGERLTKPTNELFFKKMSTWSICSKKSIQYLAHLSLEEMECFNNNIVYYYTYN